MCGEQTIHMLWIIIMAGSPPRVRGTGAAAGDGLACVRITPACAGNRNIARCKKIVLQDHPRVCGEQHRFLFRLLLTAGSPPRVRGTVTVSIPDHTHGRITPACAGNRPSGW